MIKSSVVLSILYIMNKAVGGRPPRYAPAPLLSLWAPKRLPPPSIRRCSSSFPRPTRSHAHRCSCLTRQHSGKQSGLVTLTFDLLTLKVVSESRVTSATSVPILIFLYTYCSRLRSDVRDRQTSNRQTDARHQTSDVRQKHRLMPPPIRDGGIIKLTRFATD